MDKSISSATIKRLPIYLRYLEMLSKLGAKNVSSQEIGNFLGFKSSQVRKDLSFFGDFGKKGVGYEIDFLICEIRKILNLEKVIPILLIGAGRLGQALCHYNIEQNDTMKIVSVFDHSKEVVGQDISHLKVQPVNEIEKTIKKKEIKLGIICVPPKFAQSVADDLVRYGIKAILNFAPVPIRVPEDVKVKSVDFTADLHSLSYFLK